ncbi:MAG: hypothetical protein ABJH85_15445 [Paracoccaceae bacterium]
MFALSLSYKGIQLLHRGAGGWRLVGDLGLDASDLNAELAALRKSAGLIEPDGVHCKIIIPNDQIKYLTIDHDASSEQDIDTAARNALANGTSLIVSDLAYDVSVDDNVLHIAAVAYDTLAEAEAFAAEHDFNPMCFTAIPGDAGFLGAPDFGLTEHARTQLKPGESLESDDVAVVIVGTAEIPSAPDIEIGEVSATAQVEPVEEVTAEAHAPPDDPETDLCHSESTVQELDVIPAFSSVRSAPEELVQADAPVATPESASVAGQDQVEKKTTVVVPAKKPVDFLSRRTPDRLPPAPPLPADEAESLTVFGARASADTPRQTGYLGYALTAVLLLSLGGVATWASLFLDNGVADLFGENSDEPVVMSVEAPDADLTDMDAAVLDALREPEPPQELTPENTEARYAVSGIWETAPHAPMTPEVIDLDGLYIASIDSVAVTHDAIALPSATALQTDNRPAPVSSPAVSGTLFALDDSGLVIPTKEGVLAPSGITVYLGRPPVVPPRVPAREQPPTETENLLQSRLAKLRPRLRPDDLVEQNERSQLGGLTRNELSGLRPKARPEVEKVEEERDTTPTAQAVVSSRKPKARPKNFARIVKRAQPKAPKSTTVASAATFAPATVVPKIPTSASVSKQATVRNAINLGRINLIGVYGKPSSRRALVRLSSGRYQKVKVGDRLDGGRISAISDSELSYVKRGRSVVLKMPKS